MSYRSHQSATEVLQQRQAEEATLAYDLRYHWIALLHWTTWAHSVIMTISNHLKIFVYRLKINKFVVHLGKNTLRVQILASYDFVKL